MDRARDSRRERLPRGQPFGRRQLEVVRRLPREAEATGRRALGVTPGVVPYSVDLLGDQMEHLLERDHRPAVPAAKRWHVGIGAERGPGGATERHERAADERLHVRQRAWAALDEIVQVLHVLRQVL